MDIKTNLSVVCRCPCKRVYAYVCGCVCARECLTDGMREDVSGMLAAEMHMCEETKWVLAYRFRDSGRQM